jgi:hypothetical protein
VELETNQPNGQGSYTPLQKPTPAQSKLVSTYDKPPYVSPQSSGGIPFVDFGNRYLVSGASYSPQVLQGLSRGTIAGSLSIPDAKSAQAVDATANYLTAAVCQITHNRPASVCSTPAITKAGAALASGKPAP